MAFGIIQIGEAEGSIITVSTCVSTRPKNSQNWQKWSKICKTNPTSIRLQSEKQSIIVEEQAVCICTEFQRKISELKENEKITKR